MKLMLRFLAVLLFTMPAWPFVIGWPDCIDSTAGRIVFGVVLWWVGVLMAVVLFATSLDDER